MRRAAVVVFCAALVMIGLTAAAYADTAVTLFSGELQGVELESWGAGEAEIDEDETYLEASALRVETTGFFEGARLDLQDPLEPDPFLEDAPGGYVKLIVKVHEPEPERMGVGEGARGGGPRGGGPGMMPPGMEAGPWMEGGPAMPGEGGPGMPAEGGAMQPPGGEMMPPEGGMMPPGMEGGGMMPPGGGMMGPGMGVAQEEPEKIERVRVLVVTDKGAIDSGALELADYREIVEGWVQVVVPLSAFTGAVDVSDSEIRHVALFGDVDETFWVGELEIGHEEQPLIADAGENITTEVGKITQFEAAPQAEGVSANYVWDFDDLNGLQEEGYGQTPTWTFLTPGFYTVTLTVTDADGDRVERTDRMHVKVEE